MTGFPPPQPAEWPRRAPDDPGLDKPDHVDRNRAVAGRPSTAAKGSLRDLVPPGGFWE